MILIKFLKFLLVGLSGMIIDFSITYFIKEKLSLDKYFANSIGFSVAAISNFVLNKYFTYNSTNPEIIQEFYYFFAISIISLFIYNGVLWFSINKLKLKFYFAKMLGIFFITFWNFFAHLHITFQ